MDKKIDEAMQDYKRKEEKWIGYLESECIDSRGFAIRMYGHLDSLVNRNIMTREERAAEHIRIQEMLCEIEWNKLKKLDGK